MKSMFRFSFASFILILLFACSSSKKLTGSQNNPSPEIVKAIPLDTLINKILKNQENSYLTLKGELTYDSPKERMESRISLYSIKDSLCLIIIKKIGVEAFRILISKDSVKMLDRIHQEYICGSYDAFTAPYQINFPFYGIHDVLSNGCFLMEDLYYESSIEYNLYKIKAYSETLQSEITIDPAFYPSAFNLKNTNYNMTLQTTKRKWINEKYIPSVLKLLINDPAEVLFSIRLNWEDVRLDPIQQIHFNIPDYYVKHYK